MSISKFNKYAERGLSGLVNLGNTCFLNSTMQILSHTYELTSFLEKGDFVNRLNRKPDSIILVEWHKLLGELWSQNATVSPNNFLRAVQKVAAHKGQTLFTGFNQNDMPEFLIFIIDCFHNALSREVIMTIEGNVKGQKDKIAIQCYERVKQMYEKDYSEMWSIFYGIQVSQLTNVSSEEVLSLTPEPFFIIDLPVPQNTNLTSLRDCFELYVQGEVLDGDNMVTDEKTGQKVVARKSLKFWSLPSVLVIDVKRFNGFRNKNQALIDFPLTGLDLSCYVVGYNRSSYVYDLYAVCNHSGSLLGGHYTSYVKNANGKWYHFNDGSVQEVADEHQIVSTKAYCFFYRKR